MLYCYNVLSLYLLCQSITFNSTLKGIPISTYDYTISLALFDYVPILFSAFGFILCARIVHQFDTKSAISWAPLAFFGAGLLVTGGLLKATWKLLVAAQIADVAWMNNALFICLAPGMTLLAWTLSGARNQWQSRHWALVAIVALWLAALSLALAFPDARRWVIVLIAATTLANVWLGAQLIALAWRNNLNLACAFIVINLAGVFVLSGLSRLPQQTADLQWIQEIFNALSQSAFAVAAYWIFRKQRYSNTTPIAE